MKRSNNVLKTWILLCLAAVCSLGQARAAEDALLDMLPAETLACVRINHFNTALSGLDAYLTGASPIPVSLAMLANMQVAGLIGDPMMNGIDMNGNVCFVLLPQADSPQPVGGLLMPMTSFAEFVEKNPNCAKNDAGTIILTSASSPVGNLALAELAGGKYALAIPESFGTLTAVRVMLSGGDPSLKSTLTAAQAAEAVTAPAWAYINTAALYKTYGAGLMDQFQAVQPQIAAAQGEQMGEMAGLVDLYLKIYAELFTTMAGDAEAVTLALTPEAASLTLDVSLKAKDGSTTAGMLMADPAAANGFSYTGYLDETYAVNGLIRINQPALQNMYAAMFDIFDKAKAESGPSETMKKMESLTRQILAATGDEAAFSFSYAGQKPPFKLTEVVAVRDMQAMRKPLEESLTLVNDFYAEIGLPMTLDITKNTSTYKGMTLDTVVLTMPASEDPNDPMTAVMEQVYGDALTYMMAYGNDAYYLTMGPDAEASIKQLIDQSAAAPADGEVKAALDLLAAGGYRDAACSVNIIKLITGMGEMMEGLGASPVAGCGPAMPMLLLKDIDVPTQSSLAVGARLTDGAVSLRTVLPKQHLVELMTFIMQAQQKMSQPAPAETGQMQ